MVRFPDGVGAVGPTTAFAELFGAAAGVEGRVAPTERTPLGDAGAVSATTGTLEGAAAVSSGGGAGTLTLLDAVTIARAVAATGAAAGTVAIIVAARRAEAAVVVAAAGALGVC